MKRLFRDIRSLLGCLLALAALPVHAAPGDLTDAVQRVVPSVVHIAIGSPRATLDPSIDDAPANDALVTPAHRGRQTVGSGIIIGEDGLILTVAYLFEPPDSAKVRLSDGREFPAKLLGRDRRSGIALIKIDATGLPAAKIGDPKKLRLAERVFAIGALPSGISATVTDGIVSVLALEQKDLAAFIQMTAPLYPGMGGGALCNQDGEVVGVGSVIYQRKTGPGLSFAIPINDAMAVAAELRAKGRVQRGSMGLVVQEITPEMLRAFGLSTPGALVNSVQPGKPAAKAGVAQGDVITRIAGDIVRSPGDAVRAITRQKPGTRVPVELLRLKTGQSLKLDVEVVDAGD